MAGNVRYQIFVSSTYKDLYPARRKVTEHILSMNHIPAGMEMFSASGREQWKTIQKAIDNSDYYVLIIGERYGSISEEDGISFTEKEFNYARAKQIPTLCFLPSSEFATSRDNRETEPDKIKMLDIFKQKVLRDQLCDFWGTEDELVTKVSASLYKIFTEEPGIGWIRGNSVDPEALSKLVRTMEENSTLRDRIRQLEEQTLRRKPSLSLCINGHDSTSGPLNIKIPELDSEVKSAAIVKRLSRSDVPIFLSHSVNDLAIKEYNEKLPSDDDVLTYFEQMQFYLLAKEANTTFSINNTSTIKANNVSIRIILPEGMLALSSSEVEELDKPVLDIPINPIVEAERKRKIGSLESDFSFLSAMKSNLSGNFIYPPVNHDLYIDDKNKITGTVSFVRQNTVDNLAADIHLIPQKRGSFLVSVSLLCDEFPNWVTNEFEIIVS